jgi:transposase-like protein
MASQVGKRYVCKKCGAEFIVTRGGNGTVRCCGQPMELKVADALKKSSLGVKTEGGRE